MTSTSQASQPKLFDENLTSFQKLVLAHMKLACGWVLLGAFLHGNRNLPVILM